VIVPTYALPDPIRGDRAQALLAETSPALVPGISLAGGWQTPELAPDTTAAISLCWVTTQPVSEVYAVHLEVTGADGQGYGSHETIPGNGRFPPSLWSVGAPFCDQHPLTVRGDFPAPGLGQIAIQLSAPPQPDGPILEQVFVPSPRVGVVVNRPVLVRAPSTVMATAAQAKPAVLTDVVFEGQLRLLGYDLEAEEGSGYRLRLYWTAERALPESYTIFAHLRDTPTTAFSQSDQMPRQGAYPTTYWRTGELVIDEHWLPVPEPAPTSLQLVLGVYTGERRLLVAVDGGPLEVEAVLQNVP
jgi:hypothetical protein